MKERYHQYLELAKKLAAKAGNRLYKEFAKEGKYEVSFKGKADVVTKADTIAEEIIISGIKESFPKHSILSEESGTEDNNSGYMWIVDPLDGTTNFAVKLPFFCTSIALTKNQEIIAGAVYNPIENALYSATADEVTKLNDKEIRPNQNADPEKTFHSFCYGSDMTNRLKAAEYYKITKKLGMPSRQLGASALEMARISSGIIDSFYNPGAKIWDVAAGVLIVKQAGGVVTDIDGSPYHPDAAGILASSNPKLHEKLIKIIPKNVQ
jgi:myo-inositol-1(or 4)-monophosphatase